MSRWRRLCAAIYNDAHVEHLTRDELEQQLAALPPGRFEYARNKIANLLAR